MISLTGCRKAAVEAHSPRVETAIFIGDPAYVMKSKGEGEDPWYRKLQVVFDERPADEKALDAHVAANRAAVDDAMRGLLQEVEHAVQDRRTARDRWSIISMTAGRTRRGSEIMFSADIGLTKLYARRPVISFNNLPLELCVSKLSRESEIQFSQPRGYDPVVTWSKINVTTAEAFEGVLAAHGFDFKFTDTKYSISLRLQDSPTREEFVRAAADQILQKGKLLNAARPAITVTQREAAPQAAMPSAPAKKSGDANVKTPAPATK